MSGGIVPSASRQYLLLSGVFLILDDYSRFSMINAPPNGATAFTANG